MRRGNFFIQNLLKRLIKIGSRPVALVLILLTASVLPVFSKTNDTSQLAPDIDIVGPPGSGSFGKQVYALPGGNIVVTDPLFDIAGGAANVGAVYLYNGINGALINVITGSSANDQLSSEGIAVLTNGNYVIKSRNWSNGGVTFAGAITFCSGTTGCSGTVSAANSLVGSQNQDGFGLEVYPLSNGNYVARFPDWNNGATQNVGAVSLCSGTTGCTGAVSTANSLYGTSMNDVIGGGDNGIIVLTNGNYVVSSSLWDFGTATNVGAVTWGNGTTGIVGPVSPANSLIGSSNNDGVGFVTPLPNGNYFVSSASWNNVAIADVGAVTFGDGTNGTTGLVSPANSLVGSSDGDAVGFNRRVLTNGNFVITSPFWRNGSIANAGAATFCSGTTGCTAAPVSVSNSLVGTTVDDRVGLFGVTPLANGNYLVGTHSWNNAGAAFAGAVTFGDGTNGTTGPVSPANSLVGTTANDQVGAGRILVLTNGNYVVQSPGWDNGGAVNAGAATWCRGTTGCAGTISAVNSLVGTTANDQVGGEIASIVLTNGNYVVVSPNWNNGALARAGAATWGDGTTGITGTISAANSLIGSTALDSVGFGFNTALPNGNYVIGSMSWDNGGITNAGAATFGNGTTGVSGVISSANSLVGATFNENLGSRGIFPLTNGNYLISTPDWDNGASTNAGAVTFANGANGITGFISSANSLIGSSLNDLVGFNLVITLPNGNYMVHSPSFDRNGTQNAGAITRGGGNVGTTGLIDSTNSVFGTAADGGGLMVFVFDAVNNQLVVGRPADNIVTLSRPFAPTAANISIAGRVSSGKGGVSGALVSLTDSSGVTRSVRANSFGYYKIENVPAGQSVIVRASAKGLSFNPQIVTTHDNITDLNFIAGF